MEGTRFFTELGAQLPEPIGPLVAQVGPVAGLVATYAAMWALIGGMLPGVARRMMRTSRETRSPGDPRRYGGLEVYRLWVNKGEEVEHHRVISALSALLFDRREGVYLELHVGEFTDVVLAGRDIEPVLRALRANYQGNVQFVAVPPEEDPFAPPISEAVRRVVGAESQSGSSAPEDGMVEVCRAYRIDGADGWGSRALEEFAGSADPVDSGLSQIRDALEVDRGEAAMIQLHLRPATPASVKELGSQEEAYKNHPRKAKLGSFGWLMFYKSLGEPGRDWARQRGYGAQGEKRDPQETFESKRVKERRNVPSLYEVDLVAFGRIGSARRPLLEQAFDKYFGVYEERSGTKGGSRMRAKARGDAACLMSTIRMPGVWPSNKQASPVMKPSEIAAMWHPLGADARTPGRRESLVVSVPPPATLPKTGVTLARSNFAGLEREVRLDHEALCRHGRLLGVPGVGKTAALYRLGEAILTTPGAGGEKMGMFCLDPKSDLFTVLLENVGRLGRARDTVVLDPGDDRFPVPGMNVLAPQSWMSERKQAQILVGAFRTRFASIGWGAKMEEFMTQALHALVAANRVLAEELGGESRYTVLDLSSARFLAPKTELGKDEWEPAPMRAEVLRTLDSAKEPHRYADLTRFWESFDANYRASAQKTEINPVTNKINQLLTDAIIPVFGAPHCDIDFLQMMSEGKVFLANLSKNTFGNEGSRLFGSLLLNLSLAASQYRHDQIKRGTFPGRPTEFVYLIDEVQDFTCPEMCDIINQGRAYRTPLWVAHQEMRQIQDPEIDAAFDGVGTSMYFRNDPRDSLRVSKVLGEPFSAPVMANMGKHNFVIRGDNMRVTCSTLRLPDEATSQERGAAQARALEARRISAELYATDWDPEAEERLRAQRYGLLRKNDSPADGRPSPLPPNPDPDPQNPQVPGEHGPNTFKRRWRQDNQPGPPDHDRTTDGSDEAFDLASFEARVAGEDPGETEGDPRPDFPEED